MSCAQRQFNSFLVWSRKVWRTEFKNAAMDPVSLAVSQSCINPAGMSPEWFEPQSEQRMNVLMMTDGSYERNCDKTCVLFPPRSFGMQDFCEPLGRCKSLFHLVGEKTKSFLKFNWCGIDWVKPLCFFQEMLMYLLETITQHLVIRLNHMRYHDRVFGMFLPQQPKKKNFGHLSVGKFASLEQQNRVVQKDWDSIS